MFRYICVSFAVLASFLVASLTNEEITKLNEDVNIATKKCMEDFKITKEDFQKAKHKDIEAIEPCLFACIMKGKGIMDDKGMLDDKAAYAIAEKFVKSPEDLENIKKIGNACLPVNEVKVSDGEEGCERAMLLLQCFVENKGELKM